MDFELRGKHALITGGSKGIGLACARTFLEEGAKVSLVARTLDALHAAQTALQADFPGSSVQVFVADLKDAAQAATVVVQAEDQSGPIDCLVNSAGAARRTPPEELTPQHWRDGMDAKYFPYINVIDPVVKRMAKRGSGSIVNIAGTGGKVATPTHLPGGAANAALMLMTVGLAAAYARSGVRVNAINPTMTLTERMDEGLAVQARVQGISKEEALAKATERMPLGRPLLPAEVAKSVVFLCSPCASYVSGVVLSMDGALTPIVV